MSDQKETNEKQLDKMTVKELREIAADIPEITGVSGMKKAELFEAIKKAKGIEDDKAEKPQKTSTDKVIDVKKKIKLLKSQRLDALASGDRKTSKILRRRINRLKKKSRRAA
jgi:hypothetical protein